MRNTSDWSDCLEVHPTIRVRRQPRGWLVDDDFDDQPSLFRTREAAIAYATELAADFIRG